MMLDRIGIGRKPLILVALPTLVTPTFGWSPPRRRRCDERRQAKPTRGHAGGELIPQEILKARAARFVRAFSGHVHTMREPAVRHDETPGCDVSVLLTPSGFVTPRSNRWAPDAPRSSGPNELHAEFVRASGAAGQARRAIAEHFRDRVRPSIVADAQLVVSELVSNAVEHGIGETLSLDASSDTDSISLSVRSRCRIRDLRRQPDWELPDPWQICGRGLPIVSTLSTSTPSVESSPDGAWFNQVTVTAHLT